MELKLEDFINKESIGLARAIGLTKEELRLNTFNTVFEIEAINTATQSVKPQIDSDELFEYNDTEVVKVHEYRIIRKDTQDDILKTTIDSESELIDLLNDVFKIKL